VFIFGITGINRRRYQILCPTCVSRCGCGTTGIFPIPLRPPRLHSQLNW